MNNDHYDGFYKYDKEVANSYDQSRQHEHHWEQEDKFIALYLQNKNIKDLLDLPVGTGRFFKHYNHIRNLTGVDISEDMLSKAKERLSLLPAEVAVRIEQHDVTSLPFSDNSFDTVITFRLFHLLPEKYLHQAIKELCRVSRRDIVAQTYSQIKHTNDNTSTFTKKIFRKILNFIKKIKITNNYQTTPWSHIESYSHDKKSIDDIFLKYKFHPTKSTLLDIYENSEVMATVYTKSVYKNN